MYLVSWSLIPSTFLFLNFLQEVLLRNTSLWTLRSSSIDSTLLVWNPEVKNLAFDWELDPIPGLPSIQILRDSIQFVLLNCCILKLAPKSDLSPIAWEPFLVLLLNCSFDPTLFFLLVFAKILVFVCFFNADSDLRPYDSSVQLWKHIGYNSGAVYDFLCVICCTVEA